MKSRGLTCAEVHRLIEQLLDGDLSGCDEKAVSGHLKACPSCSHRFALDLALIGAIRTGPHEGLESVAGGVLARLGARERRLRRLRWAGVFAAVGLLGFVTSVLGPGALDWVLGLLRGGRAGGPGLMALGKIWAVLASLGEIARARIYDGLVALEAGGYMPQVLGSIAGMFVVVVFLMYAMGLWLNRPREVGNGIKVRS